MLEFGRREWGAVAAIAAAATVGGTGWWTLHQRTARQSPPKDIRPTFSDGTPARTASADGTLDLPAQGPEESPSPSPGPSGNPSGEIIVYVTGAVKRPGVYTLRSGARIYNAVRAAGGFKEDAQTDALNLADAVRDADQINIPVRSHDSGSAEVQVATAKESGFRMEPAPARRHITFTPVSLPPPTITVRPLIVPGTALTAASPSPRPQGRVLGKVQVPAIAPEASPSPPPSPEPTTAPIITPAPADTPIASADAPRVARESDTAEPGSKSSTRGRSRERASTKFRSPGDGLVDINTASLEELEKLPGIGVGMAQHIVDYRTQIGRFSSVEQLKDVRGIGAKRFEKMHCNVNGEISVAVLDGV